MGAYNSADYLPRTLRSLLDQSYRNLEVIVVDDGSTDETAAVITEWAARDDRVRLVSLPENQGRSRARNAGLEAAHGEWVAINDADDLWHPDRIAELVAASVQFPQSSVITDDIMSYSISGGTADRGDGQGAGAGSAPESGNDAGAGTEITLGHRHVSRSTWRLGTPHEISVRGWFMDNSCHMRPMIRRSFLESTGVRYPEEMSAGEDNNFYMSLVFNRQNPRTVRVPRAMYYYVEGASTRHTSMAQNRLWSIRNILDATGSADLAKWSKRSDPGRLWVLNRSDHAFKSEGRSAGVDKVSQDEPIELPPLNPVRGYLTLIWWKALEMLSRVADRSARPAIVADIKRQLSR